MNGWITSEKEYLSHLFSKMGRENYSWRDDAIIIPITDHQSLLYSIDNAEQIYSTNNREHDMRLYGRWAASLIASDIISCGFLPRGLSIDMGIKDKSEIDCNNFIEGILDVCTLYNMKYEGGNINTTDSVSGIAWAYGNDEDIIRRDGAKPGDIILVTCDLGVGWADKLLRNADIQSPLSGYKEFPIINASLFKEVWDLRVINCGMDLTDGVIEFGYEISERTGFGVVFDPKPNGSTLLKYASSELNIPETAFRFEPGYDTPFAHGWCINKENISLVKNLFKKYNVKYTEMGYVDSCRNNVVVKYGNKYVQLPRYCDDIISNRGSIEGWKKQIVSLLCNS